MGHYLEKDERGVRRTSTPVTFEAGDAFPMGREPQMQSMDVRGGDACEDTPHTGDFTFVDFGNESAGVVDGSVEQGAV
ncbi:unnamed protein product [Sphagnum balticum]